MQSLLIFLFTAFTLLAPAYAEDPSVEQYARLDRVGKEQLIRRWLVDRFDTAARIALDEPERQQLAEKYEDLLHRLAAGESLSEAGYRRLLQEVGAAEQAAIDRLSLRYRVLVYSRFRTNRAAYDERMAEWRKLMADWAAGDAKISNGSLVIDWLNRSLDRLQYDEVANLPKLPDFAALPPLTLPRPGLETGELHPADPYLATQHKASVPATVPSLGNAAKAPFAPHSPPPSADSPRIAHRVERPPIPQTGPPPRAIVRDVQPVIAPPEPPRPPESSADKPPVIIDLEEIAVRIRGYNLALKDLISSLHDDALWTPELLQQSLAQLEDLAARRTQINLYRELVSHDEQKLVGSPMTLATPIALLGAKIFSTRSSLSREGETAIAKAQLDQLDSLSRKLAQLAAERVEKQ
jgi:hypothetical protein